jgi:hypothetical protein
MTQKQRTNKETDRALKELKQIKHLLIISLLKAGATSEEVNLATGMGAANIRAMFPMKRGRRKGSKSSDQDGRTSAKGK